MSSTQTRPESVVIGGGIVGICCALFLQKEGHAVTLVDPAESGESTAKWSCGQMAVSEVVPLSKKGILKKLPVWLIDQQSPLMLRPRALPQMAEWFFRFLMCAREQKIREIACAISSLTVCAYEDYATLDEISGGSGFFGGRPVLELFDSYEDLDEEREYLNLRQSLGFKHHELSESDIAGLEPVFAGKFRHGLIFDDWTAVKDTKGLMTLLTQVFIDHGGVRIRNEADQLLVEGRRVRAVHLVTGQELAADNVIIAAGAGSRKFFKTLGLNIPLAAVAGYQVVLPQPDIQIRHSTIYFNGGFCFTPMTRGLQIGGTIEFSPAGSAPDFNRSDLILQKALNVLPQLNTENMEYGVGYRPFLPDTKPVLGLSAHFPNVALAFGHGQLGLTLAATSGRIVADLLQGRHSGIDLSPFSPTRFGLIK